MAEDTELPDFNEEPLDIVETRPLRRITLIGIFSSILDAFNIERGGIYTLKAIFKNPGYAVRDYLGRNRYHYTPPFRILVISTALILFVLNFSAAADDFTTGFKMGASSPERAEELWAQIQMIRPYLNLILWSLIPFYALVTFLLNRKREYNYAEHLVFHTYLFCISNIVSLIILFDRIVESYILLSVITVTSLIYLLYGYKVLMQRSWGRSFLDTIITYFLGGALWLAFLSIIAVGVATYMAIFNPEAL